MASGTTILPLITGGGGGGITILSISTANGFSGSSSGGTTPSLTLSTTITGILKGNGTSISAASAGDFPTLNQNTTGTAANITGTSNATLTTLSALTSAAALATVGTITTGVWKGTCNMGNSFITSGTTYTTPAGITANTQFKFTLVGGGGAGGGITGGNPASSAGGGGGGGTAIVYLTGLTASTAYTITIGAGGAGSAAATGGAGGSTTLVVGATTYTAVGGSGGIANTNGFVLGGVGGSTTNAPISVPGSDGGPGGYAIVFAAPLVISGSGGRSLLGLGAVGVLPGVPGSGTFPGAVGTGYGSGGSGGASNSSTATTQPGGNGTSGCILVEWSN